MRTLALFLLMTASLSAADLTGVAIADHDRSPLAVAAVTLRQGNVVVIELETDDQGRFGATNVPAGQYTLEVKKSSFVTLERRVTIRNAAVNLLLRVVKHGAITGTVVDFDGRPVRNAVVAAVPVTADGDKISFGRGTATGLAGARTGVATDSRGSYRIYGLVPGTYAVALTLGQTRELVSSERNIVPDTTMGNNFQLYPSSSRPQTFTFRGGEEVGSVNFSAYRGPLYTIKGTVSGAANGYRLTLQNADVRTVSLGETSATPGKGFEFTRVPPGAYRIIAVSQQAYMQELPPEFVVPANIPPGITIVEVRPGVMAIVGTVPAGTNVDNAPIRPVGNVVESTFGEQSFFVGNADVEVLIPTYRGITAKVVYRPGEGCDPRAAIQMTPLEDWGTGTNSRTMEAEKEVTLTALPPVTYRLTLNGPKCYLQQTEIDSRQVSGEAIPLVAMPYASIKGKIKTAALPADAYDLALTTPSGATQWLQPDAQAAFSFTQLRPGRYRVAVYQGNGDRSTPLAMQEIDVSGGSPTEIEFPQLP